MNISKIHLSAALLAFCTSANAIDFYTPETNTITIANVDVGDITYSKVKVKLAEVKNLKQVAPESINDQYSFVDGLLKIARVYVGTKPYSNVTVSIGEVVSVGGGFAKSAIMPSGETSASFNAKVLDAWNQKPLYIDNSDYERQLLSLAEKNSCFGFFSADIIPTKPKLISWKNSQIIGTLYPLRFNRFTPNNMPYKAEPIPFSKVNIDANVYAQNDENVGNLRRFLVDMNQYLASAQADSMYLVQLKNFLIKFAEKNALSDGLYTNWSTTITENTPVHFEILSLSLNLIHSFNYTQELMTQDEKETVGNWLNRIVTTTIKSSWGGSRQDNKAYYRSQIALAWGLIIGDADLVKNAILIFKNAINEMRVDGSFVNESSRGGSANLYQSQATDSLISLATSLEENLGLPALNFEINNKSVWSAANRTLDAFENQVKIASQYGKSCESASYGSTASPDSRWGNLQSISFLRIGLYRDAPSQLLQRLQILPFDSYYYPEREGIDLITLLAR
ncbi:MAG: alginate lyase family protein [Burkholderiaceae bacterium]